MKVVLVCLLLLAAVAYVTAECNISITEDNYVIGTDCIARAHPSGLSQKLHLEIEELKKWEETFMFYKTLFVGFTVGLYVARLFK